MPTATSSSPSPIPIEANIYGCNRVDSTIFGFGRGADNCHTELLLGFLRNPKFDLRSIVQVIQEHTLPLRREIEREPSLPYNLTGQINQHPRAAIKWREGNTPDDFLAFYDKVVAEL